MNRGFSPFLRTFLGVCALGSALSNAGSAEYFLVEGQQIALTETQFGPRDNDEESWTMPEEKEILAKPQRAPFEEEEAQGWSAFLRVTKPDEDPDDLFSMLLTENENFTRGMQEQNRNALEDFRMRSEVFALQRDSRFSSATYSSSKEAELRQTLANSLKKHVTASGFSQWLKLHSQTRKFGRQVEQAVTPKVIGSAPPINAEKGDEPWSWKLEMQPLKGLSLMTAEGDAWKPFTKISASRHAMEYYSFASVEPKWIGHKGMDAAQMGYLPVSTWRTGIKYFLERKLPEFIEISFWVNEDASCLSYTKTFTPLLQVYVALVVPASSSSLVTEKHSDLGVRWQF